MAIVRTIVLLFGWAAGQQLELKGDKPWYEQYFFNPAFGQAAYWAKQSDNEVILDGQVLDWAFVDDPDPTLTNRTDVINFAIGAMENDRHIEFIAYDLVVVVAGVPDSVKTDGGSTTARSSWRTHAGVVLRVDDRFDFVEHEIGHALGLNHSFGAWNYKNSPWSQQGEYGHPYCVMSAMGYGGIGSPYLPAVPRDGRKEYSGLGPSLNAATALARGWVDAYQYDLPGAQPTEIVLRSRHWGGRNPHLAAQALNVRAADGQNYVLEYRENTGWDQGQGAPALIVSQGHGSTADQAYPNANSATFLGALRLPITFGGIGSTYRGPSWGIQMLDRSTAHHTITFKVFPGPAPLTYFHLTSTVDILEETVLETGETHFEPGEKICIEGTWPYWKVSRSQVATFEATYALAVPPITSAWTIDDQVLANPGGTITLFKEVKVANAALDDVKSGRMISMRYEIEPLPTGSRLRLFNAPDDESYSVDVTASLTTDLGAGSAEDTAKFEGIKYAYSQEFYDKRNACITNFGRIADRYLRYKVLLPPDLWKKKVPEDRFVEIQQFVDALSYLRSRDDERPYLQALSVLGELTGIVPSEVRVVALDDVLELARPEYQPELLDPEFTRRDDTG